MSLNEVDRRKQYKNVAKHEDMRRRRTAGSVELRKQKKDEHMMKRRNIQEDIISETAGCNDIETNSTGNDEKGKQKEASMTLSEAAATLKANPTSEQKRHVFEMIRRLLSKTDNPLVNDIVQLGFLNDLIIALDHIDERIQYEACWSLTNIFSGDSSYAFKAVELNAIPALVKLCYSHYLTITEQAIWALANIVGDCPELRDRVVNCGGIDAINHILKNSGTLAESCTRLLSWGFSNFCRHRDPQLPLELLESIVPSLHRLLRSSDNITVLDACWAVSYVSEGTAEQVNLILRCEILPYIVPLIDVENLSAVVPAIRIFGNLSTGSDSVTQKVIDAGVLASLQTLMERGVNSVTKECCWLLSNVLAGTTEQVESVIREGLIPVLLKVLDMGNFKIQYEVSWALANFCERPDSAKMMMLFSLNAAPIICKLLTVNENDMLYNLLDVLCTMLKGVSCQSADVLKELIDQIEESDGLVALEILQHHELDKIYEAVYYIIDNYFKSENSKDNEDPVMEEVTME